MKQAKEIGVDDISPVGRMVVSEGGEESYARRVDDAGYGSGSAGGSECGSDARRITNIAC
jgi:hypothetical protein